jgi:hypothetical protein
MHDYATSMHDYATHMQAALCVQDIGRRLHECHANGIPPRSVCNIMMAEAMCPGRPSLVSCCLMAKLLRLQRWLRWCSPHGCKGVPFLGADSSELPLSFCI